MMPLSCPQIISTFAPGQCAAVDNYCERLSASFDAEPINALTNIAFLIAAAGASYLYNNVPDAEPKGQLRALIYLLALVGLGSLLFHTIGTKWAQWGDVIPIMLFLTLYLWVAFTNFFNMRVMWRIITIGAVVGAAVFAEVYTTEHTKDLTNWFPGIPGEVWSGALYAPIVIALITIGFILLREQPVAGGGVMAATAVFIVSLTLRFLDSQEPLCDALPVGTHFFWHICNAITLYILLTIAIVHVRIARANQR